MGTTEIIGLVITALATIAGYLFKARDDAQQKTIEDSRREFLEHLLEDTRKHEDITKDLTDIKVATAERITRTSFENSMKLVFEKFEKLSDQLHTKQDRQ